MASDDVFVADQTTSDSLHPEGDNVIAVEMEGTALAQICHDYDVPFLVIRTISDKADHSAAVDFQSFVKEAGTHISAGIANEFLSLLPQVGRLS